MAVYPAQARAAVLPRRRLTVQERAGRSGQRVGLAMAAVIVAFLLGLFYLDQAVRTSALNYDIDSLIAEREALLRERQTLQNDLARLGSEVAVAYQALEWGLIRLGPPSVIDAR